MQKKLFSLLAVLLMLSSSVIAQITTSGINGKVIANGEAVIGATVEAVHVPSGTKYMTVTNTTGMFTINGMRVGGPYEVKISYIGYNTKVIKDITLILAETYNLNTTLNENAQELGEVLVSAKATKFTAEKTGASTNIDNQQIMNMPTVSRGITDYTRLSPYGGKGMSFAGVDGRTANFTVDGANFNNNFGLWDGLPGGGNPISIDAIEEMQVVVAPYDVRQTNFIGGGVNAITKSGTNTFKASAYVYHRNENMRGDAVYNQVIAGARENDRQTIYGFTFGGPIIKNKLFLFANAEMVKTPTVVNRWRASSDGIAKPTEFISRTTLSDLEKVSKFVRERYAGYDTGSWIDYPTEDSNYKVLARLDWNINTMNHLALRYNYTKNRKWLPTNASSMDGGTRMSGGRLSQYSMAYANSIYAMDNIVHSFSLNVNSRFSNNLSNELLVAYSKLDDVRASTSDEFPFIDILKDGQAYLSLGYELFTWNNAVHNNVWNAKDELTWYLGKHKIIGGLAYEYRMADNIYMRNGTGYYRYESLDDFLSGSTPEVVCLTYGYDGKTAPAARVRTSKYSLYAQDDWAVTQNFKLTYGLRLDDMTFNNADLMTNKAIYELDYHGRHIDTGTWPTSKIVFSPRVGFTWDVLGDKSFKLRGGTGFFSGNLPLVFFTNMPTNSGMVQYQGQLNAKTKVYDAKKKVELLKGYTGATTIDAQGNRYIDMSQFKGGLVKDATGHATIAALLDKLRSMGYPQTIQPEDGTVPSSIAGVNPNFKMPQVWKSSLAIDYAFPVSFPFSITVEGIYNKNLNAATIKDWSVPSVANFTHLNGADHRALYPAGYHVGTKAFMLENTSKGYGWSASIELNAQPTPFVNVMAAYTHTVNKEITGMPGSNAESAFTYVPTVEGPNFIKLHNSQYVTPDRFVVSLTLEDKSNNHYSFIYETWHGGDYSFMTMNDMNGDGYNYDALYIPTDQQVEQREFRFVSEDDKKRFMDYVHGNSYLKNHQGKYAEPYSYYAPWVHTVDFSYKHDFKFNIGSSKNAIQLSFDVKNLLNLFNSKWGVAKVLNPDVFGAGARPLKYEGFDDQGYALFSTPSTVSGNTKTFTPNYSLGQCWYAQIGIKYVFN